MVLGRSLRKGQKTYTPAFLPDKSLWVGLREPFAGELIIPRKLRGGYRVHINPFPCNPVGRQVRLSSNFISYTDCLATDSAKGVDRLTAATIIAAFLVSSFGQLQIESLANNREGCLSVEDHHLNLVHVIDPRQMTPTERDSILTAFSNLRYPVPMNLVASQLPDRQRLDEAIAQHICRLSGTWTPNDLLTETWGALDEYTIARNL